jgi:hypothetical protein
MQKTCGRWRDNTWNLFYHLAGRVDTASDNNVRLFQRG